MGRDEVTAAWPQGSPCRAVVFSTISDLMRLLLEAPEMSHVRHRLCLTLSRCPFLSTTGHRTTTTCGNACPRRWCLEPWLYCLMFWIALSFSSTVHREKAWDIPRVPWVKNRVTYKRPLFMDTAPGFPGILDSLHSELFLCHHSLLFLWKWGQDKQEVKELKAFGVLKPGSSKLWSCSEWGHCTAFLHEKGRSHLWWRGRNWRLLLLCSPWRGLCSACWVGPHHTAQSL